MNILRSYFSGSLWNRKRIPWNRDWWWNSKIEAWNTRSE